MRTHCLGPLLHLKNRLVARLHQLLFIALAASAEHVAQAGADILEHVDAGNHFTEHDALIAIDDVTVDRRRGGDENHDMTAFGLTTIDIFSLAPNR